MGIVASISIAQLLQSHVLFLKAQTDFPDALLLVVHAASVVLPELPLIPSLCPLTTAKTRKASPSALLASGGTV